MGQLATPLSKVKQGTKFRKIHHVNDMATGPLWVKSHYIGGNQRIWVIKTIDGRWKGRLAPTTKVYVQGV